MIKSDKFVELCKKALNSKSVYMWGSFGQDVTKSFINQKAKQYPSQYTTTKKNELYKLVGKSYKAWDCVGLIKWACWYNEAIGKTVYNVNQDIGANSAYNLAKVKGDIKTLPERAGVCVHLDGHIGVYIGNGEVIESTPAFNGGVQKTKLSQRKWLHWLEFPFVDYSDTSVKTFTNKRYNSIEEIPQGELREGVKWCIEKGYLKGNSNGLDLSDDMIRMLVILKRAINK